ncbi:MAG: SHOCT domain-containing protein [Bacilli bacterium]|nr:SHOCT domain-containing protein [Bacilli bacterium]
MKALHIFERIFHYVRIWLFIFAVLYLAFAMFGLAGVVYFDGESYVIDAEVAGVAADEAGAYVLTTVIAAGALSFYMVAGSVFFWMLEHIFKKIQVIRGKDACKCCKEEEGDAQVEKIMKWKDFYNEGIITEREFIQKRNEILGLHK